METLYENIYNLLRSFQEAASNQTDDFIDVVLKNNDGTTETVHIKSYRNLMTEITRLSNNFASLTNEKNISYIYNSDGTLSQYVKTTFVNAEYINTTDTTVAQECIVDNRTLISDFVHPLVKIPIYIDQHIKSNIICRTFDIESGYAQIPDDIPYTTFEHLISTGEVVVKSEIVRELEPERQQVNYFGEFVIKSIQQDLQQPTTYTIVLDTIYYTGINVNGNAIELRVGDQLVNETLLTRYEVTSVSKPLSTVVVKMIAGTELLSVNDLLLYNQIIPATDTIIAIPVKPSQNLVTFLSTENIEAVSYPSNGIKLATKDYKVSHEGVTYTIDEFYSAYVTNISEYLLSIINESNIPYSLGITPQTPQLLSSNFKVIQINKHVTNAKNVAEINKLNVTKNELLNQIDNLNNTVNNIINDINKNTYRTITEKNTKQAEIDQLRKNIEVLNNELLTVSRRIDNDANEISLKTYKPKYKILGFWSLQDDLYSPSTGIQHIVKYDVQYRYLNNSSENIDATTIKMVDNGKEVSVVFSPWNKCETEVLQKTKTVDGKYIWTVQSTQDIDNIAINQCAITINENESVEIRIRALSEAGYPVNPVKSDWSNILRINFPEDLRINNVSSVLYQNEVDLRNSEFNKILQMKGLISHIEDQITESEKTYHHIASYITSGLYTNEMKHIPLDVAIRQIKDEIDQLKAVGMAQPTISIVDHEGNEYSISNNQMISIYFGRLQELLDPKDQTIWGNIYKQKCFIKIKNKNSVPIEIRSLCPQSPLTSYFEETPVLNATYQQKEGQIIYFRTLDMGLNANYGVLYDTSTAPLTNNRLTAIGTNTNSATPNIIMGDTSTTPTTATCAEINTTTNTDDNFALVHYNAWNQITTAKLHEELERLEHLHGIRIDDPQIGFNKNPISSPKTGFVPNDKYAVGKHTCGSFLYPVLYDNLLVKGTSTTSSVVIDSNSEISVPFVFEYRPIDMFGRIDGLHTPVYPIKYSKKLGASMIIGNAQFLFDIECYLTID